MSSGDARIPIEALKGRGTATRLAHRFEKEARAVFDDGWDTLQQGHAEGIPPPATEVIWEDARSIITGNDSPDVFFDRSINPYRGCEHGCVYCLSGGTRVLMADGGLKPLADLAVGDQVMGTRHEGRYRRYVATSVLAHWSTRKPAYRVRLADGTALVASGDHRFLTERGWRFVAPAPRGSQRPWLTVNHPLMGFGAIATGPALGDEQSYRRGYLCGIIRGDARLGGCECEPAGGARGNPHEFRLAMVDVAALDRAGSYLAEFGIATQRYECQPASATRQRMEAIRAGAAGQVEAIRRLIEWPSPPPTDWARGFLAGLFDAGGSFQGGVLRIASTDEQVIEIGRSLLSSLAFDVAHEVQASGRAKPMHDLRVRGGLREHLRWVNLCDPAIARKRSIAGQAVKSSAGLHVVAIEPMEGEQDLFDITTGTGDFVAEGVISHNCYARPTHSYLNLSPGLDFETKIIAKRNLAPLLRHELAKPRYEPKLIAVGTATDCYQPVERELRLTRAVVELMHETSHAFSLVTKSSGVERDLDLIAPMAARGLAAVYVTITTLDPELARRLEPRAAAPHRRLRLLKTLAGHGVPCGVSLAPHIPFLTDDMEQVLEAAWEAGARSAFYHVLRLPWEVAPLFRQWLDLHYPERAARVMARVQEMRGGKDYDADFATRMKGSGVWADLIAQRFRKAVQRLGFNQQRVVLDTSQFRPPAMNGQGRLF